MRILIVEDEPSLALQLEEALVAPGYFVDKAHTGADAHYLEEIESFDAVVLDLGFPVMDGLTILNKPFHMEKLLARVRALLRRSSVHASAQWRCGAIGLDTRIAKVAVNGNPLMLTSHEYKVLAVLMQYQGEVGSRTDLVEHIYA